MFPSAAASTVRSAPSRTVALAGIVILLWLTLQAQVFHPAGPRLQSSPGELTKSDAARADVDQVYGTLPLSFEPNQGQTDPHVRFVSRGSGYTLFLTDTGPVLSLDRAPSTRHRPRARQERATSTVLRMQLAGANRDARMTGLDKLPGVTNYISGNDAGKWRTGVPTYAKVTHHRVYPGIDMVYYGRQGRLEYDFVVSPGADPKAIKLAFQGASRMEIAANGELALQVAGGRVRQPKPFTYQEINGAKRVVPSQYTVRDRRLSFDLGAYDHTRPLVIDPVLAYSTYLGGSGEDDGNGIAVDTSGSAYVTGETESINFPTRRGTFDRTINGNFDVFVTKLNARGTGLLYSTYLGGSGGDGASAIAVNALGEAFVTGQTGSPNFPTTVGAFDRIHNGGNCEGLPCPDAFVAKLNASGSRLLYSTFLGGNFDDTAAAITVSSAGSAFLTGQTSSRNFPTTPGAFDRTYTATQCGPMPCPDAWAARLNARGSALVWSTYLGGNQVDFGEDIVVNARGNAYVTGQTGSTNFPTTSGAFDRTHSSDDGFVTKLNPSGSALVYSTLLGGSVGDGAAGIAVDAAGNAYVTGFTDSVNFPAKAGSFDLTFNGGQTDGFLSKLNASGSALIYSTFLGGNDLDSGNAVMVDSAGNAYVAGGTGSANFPAAALPRAVAGNIDAWVAKVNSRGSGLVYTRRLGGSRNDTALDLAMDRARHVYLTGRADSTNFPATQGALDRTFNGLTDAWAAKVQDDGFGRAPTSPALPTP